MSSRDAITLIDIEGTQWAIRVEFQRMSIIASVSLTAGVRLTPSFQFAGFGEREGRAGR